MMALIIPRSIWYNPPEAASRLLSVKVLQEKQIERETSNFGPLTVHSYNVGPLGNNTYIIVTDDGEAVIVDPSFDSRPIWDDIVREGLNVTLVFNTHAHIDHVVENAYFVERSGAPLALHPADLPLLHNLDGQAAWMGIETPYASEPSRLLADDDVVHLESNELTVVHTPGHSSGSVSLIADGFVISGDALFAGSIGRTDLPGGNYDQLIEAIRTRLLVLPDDTVVFPGHGPSTTIGNERQSNPFLS